jgi:hypothetical protein
MDMIAEGSKNTTLTYYPNLEDSDVSYSVSLISPRGVAETGLDPQRGTFGEHAISLRFRQTDESAFRNSAYRGTNTLFWYKAGDSLEDATFARADDAVRVDKGHGTLTATTSAKARIEWLSTAGTTGYRDTPTLLLESSRTNELTYSADFTQWTNGGATVTSGQSDPYNTSSGSLLADTSTSVIQSRYLSITTGVTKPYAFSLYVKQGTTPATGGSAISVYDSSGSIYRGRMLVTWSSGVPSVAYQVGTSFAAPEPHRDGYWRVRGLTTTDGTGAADQLYIHPAWTPAGATGNIYCFGAQVE